MDFSALRLIVVWSCLRLAALICKQSVIMTQEVSMNWPSSVYLMQSSEGSHPLKGGNTKVNYFQSDSEEAYAV